MAIFDSHSRCARCRENGIGSDTCVLGQDYSALTPDQIKQLVTQTYELRKEKKAKNGKFIDPSSVTVPHMLNLLPLMLLSTSRF